MSLLFGQSHDDSKNTWERRSGPPDAAAASMESQSTLRSLTDSWEAFHMSSILAAMAPR